MDHFKKLIEVDLPLKPGALDEIQSSIELERQRCEITYLPREG